MGRGLRVRAGRGAVAGCRVKLCRGHLQACTLRPPLRSAVLWQPSRMRGGLQSSARSHIEFNFWTGTGRPFILFSCLKEADSSKEL